MSNMYGKDKFHDRQKAVLQKSAQKIENDSGWSQDNFLRGYAEEILPASGAELSFGELCAIGEQVEQEAAFSAKEAMRNKIKARRDAERYKSTGTDSEQRTPNPFEDSSAIATESPKNEDTLNTMRKHADAQSTKSAGLKTSKRRSIVEMVQKLKKYVPIVVCGDVLYYYNGYYYEAIGLEKLIKLYRKYVDYDLNNEPSLYAYKDLYQCCTTDPELERSEPENQSIHAPLENGVYDLMKKELKPHDPRRLIFTYIKASYDESAECPVFNSFLKQITHGNPQLEERFWMAIGYLMIYPARGKFFIVMGYARDSGKSVLGNFIQRLYPKESVGNLRLQEMKGTFSSMSFLNAVINLELDMPNAKLNAEVASRLKQITGGDSITVQRKYLSPVTLTRRIKFVFAGNYPLCIDGEDDALQKRIVFLPFNESIPDDQQDPYLEDKIWDERDAIVTKSLHYARKLVKLNYKFPEIPQVDDAKCIVRDSIAKTVGKFVQESCDMSEPKAVTATEDLYNAYLDYCKEKDIWACSQTAFTKGLTQMGLKHTRSRCTGEDMIVRKNPVSAFQGIKLRP
ncbi:MAG: phage/plasmid primase, P4 family [Faecalibacterium prausnitzii]